jgi:hypothetical protein
MIRYFYSLDYDPEMIFGDGRSIAKEAANNVDINHESVDHRTPVAESSPPLDSEMGDTMAKDLVSQLLKIDQTNDIEHRVFDELKLHCQVYALAEKYAIKALMILAREKFQRILEKGDVNTGLFDVVEEIYSSTPDHDRGLRDLIVAKFYAEIQYWLRQTEFHQFLTRTNSFCVDLLKETVREALKRYEQAIADVEHPGYCNSCRATLVTKRTVSRRRNVHLEKYCAKCDPWH